MTCYNAICGVELVKSLKKTLEVGNALSLLRKP